MRFNFLRFLEHKNIMYNKTELDNIVDTLYDFNCDLKGYLNNLDNTEINIVDRDNENRKILNRMLDIKNYIISEKKRELFDDTLIKKIDEVTIKYKKWMHKIEKLGNNCISNDSEINRKKYMKKLLEHDDYYNIHPIKKIHEIILIRIMYITVKILKIAY